MSLERTYRIIGSLVTPLTFLLAFIALPQVLGSLSNPSMLFDVFVIVCVIIYVVKSTSFFKRNIIPNVAAKPVTKHLIYINGAFALLLFAEALAAFIVVYAMPSVFKDVLDALSSSINQQMGQSFSTDKIYCMLKITITFFFAYTLLLAAHVIMSYVLVKKYRHLFVG